MLVDLKELLIRSEAGGYATGGFNCATLESARAAIAAAEEWNVPIILQHAQVHECYMPLELAAPIMLALAKQARVPVCVHLDHGCDFEYVMRAIQLGFTSVMYDASAKDFAANLAQTAEVVKIAHAMGVSVEAELGHMPTGDSLNNSPEQFYTDPAEAEEFVQKTGVDALAISFGTAHGVYRTEPKLDFEVIRRVRKATGGIPLVMHGGSGVSTEDYRKAIQSGIRKINYYTYEALAGGRGVTELVAKTPSGLQFHDVAVSAERAMREDVARAIGVFSGKVQAGI